MSAMPTPFQQQVDNKGLMYHPRRSEFAIRFVLGDLGSSTLQLVGTEQQVEELLYLVQLRSADRESIAHRKLITHLCEEILKDRDEHLLEKVLIELDAHAQKINISPEWIVSCFGSLLKLLTYDGGTIYSGQVLVKKHLGLYVA